MCVGEREKDRERGRERENQKKRVWRGERERERERERRKLRACEFSYTSEKKTTYRKCRSERLCSMYILRNENP